MDILAHGLWAAAAAEAANKRLAQPLNIWQAVFWGVLPDLCTFGILYLFILWNIILGKSRFSDFPRPGHVEPPANISKVFDLTKTLYNYSHSIFIFAGAFLAVSLIAGRPVWEMMAWLLHILIDLPTHTYEFFPTPALWPFSKVKFSGFNWATPWFVVINYLAIIIVFWLLR